MRHPTLPARGRSGDRGPRRPGARAAPGPAPEGWPPSGLPPPVTLGCAPLCPAQPRLPPSLTLPTSQKEYPGRFWGLRPPPDPGLLLDANAGEPARRSPIYRCRENTPFPWFRSFRPTWSPPPPEAARPRRARPIAPRGRSGAHPNGCCSQPGALPPFSFSACQRLSFSPHSPRSRFCTIVRGLVPTIYRRASAASSPPTPSSSASTFNTSSGRFGSCCNIGNVSINRPHRW